MSSSRVKSQLGFSLVEILVGLVIGLMATLVILQVFGVFEGQKRTTTGTADAQTNGSIALFTMVRDLQMAGFGLPVFNKQNPPLKCNPVTVDHDNNAATPVFDMFPVSITNGAVSDTIRVRYSTDGASASGGIAVKIVGPAPAAPEVGVDNNLGCNNGDVVIISNGAACAMTTVNDSNLLADTTHITLNNSTGAAIGASIACMGRYNQFTYTVANNQLQRNDANNTATTPIVSEIVNIQAQYGISNAPNSNQITMWVDPSGAWATPGVASTTCNATNANRNCIKAVHLAVVARNNLREKDDGSTGAVNVTATCTTSKGTVNNGPCAWDDASLASAAPVIDLSGDANWQKYRYRTYDTIVPIRNIIWSKSRM